MNSKNTLLVSIIVNAGLVVAVIALLENRPVPTVAPVQK